MKKINKKNIGIIALFVAAFILLAFSSVGAARAAANYQSEAYQAELNMQNISVTLNENGEAKAADSMDGTLLEGLVPEGETFHLGQEYSEVITATNTGNIGSYVRVVLDLYWMDENGNKRTDLKPSYIGMNLNSGGDWISDLASNGWIVDPNSSYLDGTGEQLILYYSSLLEPGKDGKPGETTNPICNFISVDPEVGKIVERTSEGEKNFTYDSVSFGVEAQVDAIQEHNASDAALSAWGVNITAENGTLTLG